MLKPRAPWNPVSVEVFDVTVSSQGQSVVEREGTTVRVQKC